MVFEMTSAFFFFMFSVYLNKTGTKLVLIVFSKQKQFSKTVTKLSFACRLPDEEAGEIPAACVVLKKEAKESEEDIVNFVASDVAQYKRVRVVHFVETIPKSPSGKIMRRVLRDNMLQIMKNK